MGKRKITNNDFVHLHNHSEYSSFDGVNKIKKFPAYAAEMGFKALAITDHGNMGGAFKFMNECNKVGIKPILGCLRKGQKIITKKGIKPVEKIKTGDFVLTHRGRFRKVLRTMQRTCKGEAYIIKTSNMANDGLLVTEEHPVLIRSIDGLVEWKKPAEIKVGYEKGKKGTDRWLSYVCLPKLEKSRHNKISVKKILPNFFYFKNESLIRRKVYGKFDSEKIWSNFPSEIEWNEDFGYLCGIYAAEGSVSKKNGRLTGSVNFSLNRSEEDFASKIIYICKSIFNLDAKIYYPKNRENSQEVVVNCLPLAYILNSLLGDSCYKKTVPSDIFSQNRLVKDAFVRGLIDGDGKKISDTNIREQETLKVSSENLAWGFRTLLADNGHWTSVRHLKPSVDEQDSSYIVSYSPNRQYSRSIESDKYIFKPIQSIDTLDIDETVYNFEVDEDNSYVSEFILHNCEMYLCQDRHVHFKAKKDKQGSILEKGQIDGRKGNRHIVLLAKNWEGYQNLCRLSQASWTEGHAFQDPRIDFDLLEKHHKGIICSSACLSSVVNANLLHGRYDQARKAAGKLKDIFGEDFFLEVMYHGIDAEAMIIPDVLKLGEELNCKVIASNDCFTEETAVWTLNGYKQIKDINIGDSVVTHKGNFRKVEFVNSTYSNEVYEVKSSLGTICFKATANHPCYIITKNGKKKFSSPYWKNVSDLDKNDFLLMHRPGSVSTFASKDIKKIDIKQYIDPKYNRYIENDTYITRQGLGGREGIVKIPRYLSITDDMLFVIGRYIAEGHCDNSSGQVGFAANDKEIELQNRIENYFSQFGISCYRPEVLEKDRKLLFSSVIWNSLLRSLCGSGAKNKHLPNFSNGYTELSLRQMSILFSAYFSGDGHLPINKDRVICAAATTSSKLSSEISHFLMEAGFLSQYTVRTKFANHKNPRSDTSKWMPLYVNHLSQNVRDDFEKLINKMDVRSFKRLKNSKYYEIDNYIAVPFISKNKIDETVKVYNIQVEEDETYIANGYIVHNCHYCEKCQGSSHELLIAMSTSKCLTNPKRIHFPYHEFYLKSAEEMQVHFGSNPRLLTNTVDIAESIDSNDIANNITGKMRLPAYHIPENFSSPHHYLEYLAYEGMKDMGWDKSPDHIERLKLELNDVKIAWENNRYDFATYFLVVQDYIIAAKEKGIIVGCGRGSGFSSVLLRCLKISYGPDPLKYGLLWERFLGFDEKFFVTERDFGIEDSTETVRNAALEAKNDDLAEDREVEDDMGGVDRY